MNKFEKLGKRLNKILGDGNNDLNTQKKLLDKAGCIMSTSSLSRLINEGRTVKESEYQRLKRFCDIYELDTIPEELDSINKPLYFSLIKEFNIKPRNIDFLKQSSLGIYKLYTSSFYMPESMQSIVIGYMRIFESGNAICVEEFQACDGTYGGNNRIEEHSGYAILKSNKMYIICSEKDDRENFKFIIFEKSIRNDNKFDYIEGVVFGTSHNFGTFNSRIVMERVSHSVEKFDFDELKKESKIRLVSEIDEAVKNSGFKEEKDGLFLEFLRQKRLRDDTIIIW